ncbi:MAG: hypothetical protein LBU79_01795 [Planctomycetota bacterium]|nr:hypothetical protein [Planctomycetota bacterium]
MVETGDTPESVRNAGHLIKTLEKKPGLTTAERDLMKQAKLRVAFWSCQKEHIPPTRENLGYVLGNDATEIMDAYDNFINRDTQIKQRDDAKRLQALRDKRKQREAQEQAKKGGKPTDKPKGKSSWWME